MTIRDRQITDHGSAMCKSFRDMLLMMTRAPQSVEMELWILSVCLLLSFNY
jgi:hypothetical protein